MSECVWKEDEDGNWHTACGHEFVFTTDPPHDWVRFCCYCGKPFKAQAFDALAEIDAEAEAEDQQP